MKVNKYLEDTESIRERKQLCLIGLIIICLGLFLGYWTAFHISAEEGAEGTITKEDTTTDTKDEKMDELMKRLEELSKEIEETEDKLEELNKSIETEDKLALRLWEINEEIEKLKEELTEPKEEDLIKSGEEEPIILDTETQYQYFPYITVITGLLMILIFRRKHT